MHDMDSYARVLAVMQRLRTPESASHIARLARLPLHEVIDALNHMVAEGIAKRSMPGWGKILYSLKSNTTSYERDTTV